MTEEQRQKFTAFISNYLTKMLTQEITNIEMVPSLIRDAVREDFDNKEKFIPVYVAQYEAGIIDEIPILLRDQAMELIELTKSSSMDRYIAQVIEGTLELDEVPVEMQGDVRQEVESLIGKKLV